jgi:excisionase family DNA binding protein
MIPDEKWFSIKEVAAILGCGRDSVVRLIQKGHLAAVVFPVMGGRGKNKKRMVSGKEINRFLREHQKKAA